MECHPLDGTLVAHLPLALADDGTQAEAMSYPDVGHRLAEESGGGPGASCPRRA
ncbi:hypothetical protein NGM37_25940, partial [Streptomyces sp. TRM76130]|nr:hypothetical protein [Streptomyces sp. TRM76130]